MVRLQEASVSGGVISRKRGVVLIRVTNVEDMHVFLKSEDRPCEFRNCCFQILLVSMDTVNLEA